MYIIFNRKMTPRSVWLCTKSLTRLTSVDIISAADGDTQMQFVNHSEVKFVCVRIPRL